MDLIYTNAARIDIGVVMDYSLDLAIGEEETDFELTVPAVWASELEYGAAIYAEGTEIGGLVDGLISSSRNDTVTFKGRTWPGVLNSKVIQPDSGEDYYTVAGDANAIMWALVSRLNLSTLFSVVSEESGIQISYRFERYIPAYEGIMAMLDTVDSKLQMSWDADGKKVVLSVVPSVDHSETALDNDSAAVTIEHTERPVNHLICLGRGELADRQVLHLYVSRTGAIGSTQGYTGVDEITAVYDNSGAESLAELRTGGVKHLKELRAQGERADISIPEEQSYDVGDTVSATELYSGRTVTVKITQKIYNLSNGVLTTNYKAGGV